MPTRPKRFCIKTGCKEIVDYGYCKEHTMVRQKTKKDYTNWYSLKSWRAMRLAILQEEPFCVECCKKGIITRAECIDHIQSHKGNWSMFMDRRNLQPLCYSCHNTKTAREDGGFGNNTQTRGN
jgi:5-methylcytosine-specific restriction protein A